MKTLFLLLLAVAVQAAEDRPAPTGHCVFAADQPVRRYELVLEKVWEGLPVTLHIWQRGDVIGTAWAECPKVPGYAFVVMAGFDGYYGNGAALAVNGATLTGTVAVVQNSADDMLSVVLQGQPETTPIYADGRLFSRTFDGIICYDLRIP